MYFFISLCVCVLGAWVCMNVHHMCAVTLRNQKRVSNSLELELQTPLETTVRCGWICGYWGSTQDPLGEGPVILTCEASLPPSKELKANLIELVDQLLPTSQHCEDRVFKPNWPLLFPPFRSIHQWLHSAPVEPLLLTWGWGMHRTSEQRHVVSSNGGVCFHTKPSRGKAWRFCGQEVPLPDAIALHFPCSTCHRTTSPKK